MDFSTQGTRRPPRTSSKGSGSVGRRLAVRAAVATIATAALVLPAAACGGAPTGASSVQGGSSSDSTHAKTLAFSRCMRGHGVANFPDPDSTGALPKRRVEQLADSSPRFVPAHRTCERLLPNSGQPTPVQVLQAWNDMRKFARCMRSHGAPSWPDPTVTSPQDNRPFFNTPAGLDPNAPQIIASIAACRRVMHASNPLVTTQ